MRRHFSAAFLSVVTSAYAERAPWKITDITVSDGKKKATNADTDASAKGVVMVAYQVEDLTTGDRDIEVWCYDTKARRPLGPPILGNTVREGYQENPAVIYLPSGDFWLLFQGNQTGVSRIYERFLSRNCLPRGPEQRQNQMEGNQRHVCGAVSRFGDRMAAWETPYGIDGSLTTHEGTIRAMPLLSNPDSKVDSNSVASRPDLTYTDLHVQPRFCLIYAQNSTGSSVAERRLYSLSGNRLEGSWQEDTGYKQYNPVITTLHNGQPFPVYGRNLDDFRALVTLEDGNVLMLFDKFSDEYGFTQTWFLQETPLYPKDPMHITPFDTTNRIDRLLFSSNSSRPSATAINDGAFAVAQISFGENDSSAIRAALILPAMEASFSHLTAILCTIVQITTLVYGILSLQRSRGGHV